MSLSIATNWARHESKYLHRQSTSVQSLTPPVTQWTGTVSVWSTDCSTLIRHGLHGVHHHAVNTFSSLGRRSDLDRYAVLDELSLLFWGQLEGLIDWLSKASRPTKHNIGHIGDGFLQVKWPNQQCQSTEGTHKTKPNRTKHHNPS